MPRIIIDQKTIEMPDGATLLQAIRKVGVHLPTLCYLEGLPPYGACRLCLVEIHAPTAAVAAACSYPVCDGLVVQTDGERALAVRRMMLEFLLARCPNSPEIRALAAEAGVHSTRLPANPNADELCVLCGLCVRVCRDAIGAAALGFNGRGANRRVGTPFDLHAESCIGCGACAAVCPTGAITVVDEDGQRRLLPFNTILPLVACETCGKTYAPEAMAFLEEIASTGAETWGFCPECRRKATTAQIIRALAR